MEQIRTKIKKWGNSFGVIIPKELMNKKGLKEDNEVVLNIELKPYTTVGDIFGILKKKSKKPTQEIMDEIDRDFWPEEK